MSYPFRWLLIASGAARMSRDRWEANPAPLCLWMVG